MLEFVTHYDIIQQLQQQQQPLPMYDIVCTCDDQSSILIMIYDFHVDKNKT